MRRRKAARSASSSRVTVMCSSIDDLARRGPQQTGQHGQHGRLARAARSHQGHKLATPHVHDRIWSTAFTMPSPVVRWVLLGHSSWPAVLLSIMPPMIRPERGQRLYPQRIADRHQPAQRPNGQRSSPSRCRTDGWLKDDGDCWAESPEHRPKRARRLPSTTPNSVTSHDLHQRSDGDGAVGGADRLEHADLRHLLQGLDLEKAADDQHADQQRKGALRVQESTAARYSRESLSQAV